MGRRAAPDPAERSWQEWCAYDTWTDKDGVQFEVCTFTSCCRSSPFPAQVLVTCYQHFTTATPAFPHPMLELADTIMTHYRMFYRALARATLKDPTNWRHSASSSPYILPRGVVEHFGAPGPTNPEDTGAYPPYRYEGEPGFFHIDLLDPEDAHVF